jgi:hypothetical protein
MAIRIVRVFADAVPDRQLTAVSQDELHFSRHKVEWIFVDLRCHQRDARTVRRQVQMCSYLAVTESPWLRDVRGRTSGGEQGSPQSKHRPV